jgi:hypothetical protein
MKITHFNKTKQKYKNIFFEGIVSIIFFPFISNLFELRKSVANETIVQPSGVPFYSKNFPFISGEMDDFYKKERTKES